MSNDYKHAVFPPSSFHRVMACPGSWQAEAKYREANPDSARRTSIYADEGTVAHEVAAGIGKGKAPSEYIGRVFHTPSGDVEVTSEMAQHAEGYVARCLAYTDAPPVRHVIEQRVETGHPDCWGTVDFGAWLPEERLLVVREFKYGRKVKYFAQNNPQLLPYALGLIRHFELKQEDLDDIILEIDQPRLGHVDIASYSTAEVMDFLNEMERVILRAKDKDAPRVYGESQCRFCCAKTRCSEYTYHMRNSLTPPGTPPIAFDELGTVANAKPSELSLDELGAIAAQAEPVRQWLKIVEEEAKRRFENGQRVPHVKLVRGRAGPRRWTAEDPVRTRLRRTFKLPINQVAPRQLISPSQVEKLIARTHPKWMRSLGKFITRSTPSLLLVPLTDPREAANIAFDDEIDTLDDLV